MTGGSCSDGLGSDPSDSGSGTGGGHVCSKTLYTAQNSPGASFTATCSPSALISGPANYFGGSNGTASVYYSASLVPVTVTPVGAVQDQSGNWDILIGQNCTPILAGIPSGCTVSNY